jgi:hypothetical protein
MKPLELDHVFMFVEPDFVDSADHAALRRFGLTVEFGRVHAGQGTANRLALFPENSLELLWLADRGEAERNPLRLDRRADWRARGGDPFGVCLRGRLDAELRERWFWPYRLEGMIDAIWIARMSDDPACPMLFVFDSEHDPRPKARGHAPELLVHPGGQSGIASVSITSSANLTNVLGAIADILPTTLQFHHGVESHLEIVLEGRRVDSLEIGPLTLSSVQTPAYAAALEKSEFK